ncbi:MAG TPA: MOSC domain-containing protein [Halanaerobiales bacterium]|nr:MOSC domain-containing protein [Halanaerobiales bacterium]
MDGKVKAVCISREKGTKKEDIKEAELIENFGIKEDAHAGKWHRQVSLLGIESINKMEEMGLDFNLDFGDFAENITTEGITLYELPIGTILNIGNEVKLEVTQIGKECHHGCEILKQVGKCIMPEEGIFTKVIKGGTIKAGDPIKIDK